MKNFDSYKNLAVDIKNYNTYLSSIDMYNQAIFQPIYSKFTNCLELAKNYYNALVKIYWPNLLFYIENYFQILLISLFMDT